MPCVCSVIDQRWRQNVVRTKQWHTRRSRVCHWWKVFFILNISTSVTRKPAFCPAFARKKAIWRDLWSIQNKAIYWLLCVAKNCDWPRKIAPLSDLSRASLLVKWKLTAKAELNCESYKSWRKCWKIKSVFVIGAALWAEKLGRCLENCRSWKNTLWKTCGCGQPRGHLLRVLNERSVNDGGDFCLLWLVILKSSWYSVGDTFWLRYCWPCQCLGKTFLYLISCPVT